MRIEIEHHGVGATELRFYELAQPQYVAIRDMMLANDPQSSFALIRSRAKAHVSEMAPSHWIVIRCHCTDEDAISEFYDTIARTLSPNSYSTDN